jgi:hypothetical protein
MSSKQKEDENEKRLINQFERGEISKSDLDSALKAYRLKKQLDRKRQELRQAKKKQLSLTVGKKRASYLQKVGKRLTR